MRRRYTIPLFEDFMRVQRLAAFQDQLRYHLNQRVKWPRTFKQFIIPDMPRRLRSKVFHLVTVPYKNRKQAREVLIKILALEKDIMPYVHFRKDGLASRFEGLREVIYGEKNAL